MTTFHLGLTVSVVGPRAKLLDMTRWPMALRLTVGTSDSVSRERAAALIKDTLPWNIWKTPQVDVAVFSQGSWKSGPCDTATPLVEEAEFLEALKRNIQFNGERLADLDLLDLTCVPKLKDVQDSDNGSATVPWPGLLKTTSALAAPTASALLCTWYFWLDRDLVTVGEGSARTVPVDLFLSAAPRTFGTAPRAGVNMIDGPNGYPVHVHSYTGGVAAGFCEALQLQSVLDHKLDEMDNFWLSIRDTRDDSLLQLGPQLEHALDPTVVLGCLSVDEVTASAEVIGPAAARPASPSEMTRAMMEWKAQAAMPSSALRDRKAAILHAASTASQDQALAARLAYAEQVGRLLRDFKPVPLDDTTTLRLMEKEIDGLAKRAEERLLPPPGSAIRPVSPAEGIDLLIGDESMRLRHFLNSDFKAVDDVAQIQLFGRRSSRREALDARPDGNGAPWHALSSAQYTVTSGDGVVALSSRHVLGVTATYQEDVLCRELSYAGANIVCAHPLSAAHREQMTDDPLESFMLADIGRQAISTGQLRSLPLRYGDYYEFAASVIDRAGGMAEELTTDAPWAFDEKRLTTLDPPQRNGVRYQRVVPVGDLNVMPATGSSWPQTPPGVSLRCMEEGVGEPTGPAPVALLLVPEGQDFVAPAGRSRPPASYRFLIGPPQADEHTLLRWSMPATTLPDAERATQAQVLGQRLVRIYEKRAELLYQSAAPSPGANAIATALPPRVLDDDPAVAAIGIRFRLEDGQFEDHVVPIDATPLSIEVAAGSPAAGTPPALSFTLGQGQVARISICALVTMADLDRFDADTLSQHLAEGQHWPGYGAFKESVVWVEVASSDLPEPDAGELRLQADELANVQVHHAVPPLKAAQVSRYRNVIQARVASERWVWRNLPIPPEDGFSGTLPECLRRIASGPPSELMDPQRRDTAPAVTTFDQLNAIDTGFVLRADRLVPYPRTSSGVALLLVDERDGQAQSDYLRYTLRFRSRYAPVLKRPETEWSGQRRIAVEFRGDRARIKPPRLLAVLPLTQDLEVAQVPSNAAGGTPFLVVLDESWFREYGIGERLEARIAFVKPEIPEGETNLPTQRRFGPLPDHHHAPRPVPQLGDPLSCFGPFGLSLDRGGSQALANATAFVVYPPAGTPPHFNLFVEFARVLDLPTQQAPRSDYSEAYPLYTLADSAALAFAEPGRVVSVTATADGYTLAGGARLAPFDGAAADPEVMGQYRYLMIVGNHVRDGGRGVDVFLPEDALWVTREGADTARAKWINTASGRSFSAAVVAEVLLNGRFEHLEHHPLSGQKTLCQLFRQLLADPTDEGHGDHPRDAPGMIRRVSPSFGISITPA